MGNSGGIINAPVSIEDIQRTIGSPNYDLGKLCTNLNINRWSRFKPISYPKLFGIVKEAFEDGKPSDDFHKVNYGLTLPDPISISGTITLDKIRTVTNQDWLYDMPHGGINSPFRMEDFIGYDHNAIPYLTLATPTVNLSDHLQGSYVAIQCMENTDGSTIPFGNLNLDKLVNGNNIYLWMYVFDSSKVLDFSKRAIGSITSGEDGITFSIPINTFSIGGFKVYYVYRDDDGRFYPTPDSPKQNPKTLTVNSGSQQDRNIDVTFYIGYNSSQMKLLQDAERYILKSQLNPLYVRIQMKNGDDIPHSYNISNIRLKNLDSDEGIWVSPKATNIELSANGYAENIYEISGDVLSVIFGENTSQRVTANIAFVRNNIIISDTQGGAEAVITFDRSGGEEWIDI